MQLPQGCRPKWGGGAEECLQGWEFWEWGQGGCRPSSWPSVSLIPVSWGHSEVLPAVCLLAFLLHCGLPPQRQEDIALPLFGPILPTIYIYTSYSRNTKTTAHFGSPPYPLLCPPLQKQLADLSLISCPSEQIHFPLCSLFLPTLHPAWGPLWPSSLFSWLSFLSFPPFLLLNSMKHNRGLEMA